MGIGTILREDDFSIGDLVTVYDNKDNGCQCPEETHPIQMIIGSGRRRQDDYTALKGRVMCIKSINLPYVALIVFDCETMKQDQTIPVDARNCNLMRITEDYCKAIFKSIRWGEVEQDIEAIRNGEVVQSSNGENCKT